MECPHLCQLNGAKVANNPVLKWLTASPDFECSVCKSKKSSWICVHCGQVGCGRYVSGHAKQHFEQMAAHSLCFDSDSFAVFWSVFVSTDYPILRPSLVFNASDSDQYNDNNESVVHIYQ
ncbi:unnamed protein product [Medioppia subpectinata]|uniref:UBP-type domain-containing protein n=1 Tax=Medioppia subpectinata TaxID=1979941 RepID=A0A7R9PUF7_9ACAR|nr:unnamed protein product [Medioppia subpectinata]CAG2101489.1 unnamed protein product [Medioppia subpectinata]